MKEVQSELAAVQGACDALHAAGHLVHEQPRLRRHAAAFALRRADEARDKGAVANTIVARGLIRPVNAALGADGADGLA